MVKEVVGAGDRLRVALDAALPPAIQRREVLNIRLSGDELAALRAEAEQRGVPMATFVRTLVLEALALLSEARPAAGAQAKGR